MVTKNAKRRKAAFEKKVAAGGNPENAIQKREWMNAATRRIKESTFRITPEREVRNIRNWTARAANPRNAREAEMATNCQSILDYR